MKRIFFGFLAAALTVSASAQLPQIRITSVYPAGAQQGTTADVTVSVGTDIDEATELLFSHPGLKATPRKDGNGNPLANQFSVTIDSSVPAGLYDVRMRGPFGVSNPRTFRVDTIPEVPEAEPNNLPEQAMAVTLGNVVNARANSAADVDMYTVGVKAGQVVVVRAEAAAIDSLMQPVVELFDASGRRVAFSRRQRQQDPVVIYKSAADQQLRVKVRDTVYGGSNDYGYRLVVDSRMLIDAVFPQVVQAGTDARVTVLGRHVPGGQDAGQALNGLPLQKKEVTIRVPNVGNRTGADSAATSIDAAIVGIEGNLISFAVHSAAVNAVAHSDEAGPVALPAAVSGSFETQQDEDTIRFAAKAGEKWQINVLAHRLGSNADPSLIVEQITKPADGAETYKRLAREDEGKINPGGGNLPTLTTDPAYLFTAPADGEYRLRLRDRFAASRGAPDLTWSVTIDPPTPDYQVVVFDSFPSVDGKQPPATGSVSIRRGGNYYIPVYAYRSGGHSAEIKLTVEGLPKGVTCAPASFLPGRQDSMLVFSAAHDAPESASPVTITATSTNGDQAMTREARVATLVHGGINGLPRTGRASSTLVVGVMRDEQPFHVEPGIVSAEMSQDQQLLIPLKLIRRAGFDNKVDIAFAGQPGNVDIPKVAIEKGKDSAVARFFFKENAAVGPATLLMYVTGQVPYRRRIWILGQAQEKVKAATEQLAATQKKLADAKSVQEAGTKKVAELTAMLKTYDGQLKAEKAAMTKAQEEVKKAVAGKVDATKQLLALQEKLKAVSAQKTEDVDAAIKAVEEATAAVVAATKPVTELSAKLEKLSGQVTAKKALVDQKTAQANAAMAEMTKQQAAVEKAKADVVAAEGNVKTQEAAKKAADEEVKKAEAATKPQNKNYRTIAVPVRLNVHTTPGKIAAAVPNSGAIKKGAAVDVKLTLTRKNNFAGAVKVALVLPDGVKAVTSNTVEIPADATEAVLKLTAAGDAAAGDIANAVIRATGEFNGRQASFDAPIGLKVTE